MYQSEKAQSVVDQLSRLNPFYGREGLADPPRPDEKSIPRDTSPHEQIPHIQKQLDLLTYNHLPNTFFNLEKHRTLHSILMTGKEALTEALPIRCLEATFVGLYLTQESKEIERIPLSFRSCANGNHYQHIVLVVYVKHPSPVYGALGLSRKRTLMYKPLCYRSLYEIVMDYKREYEALGHELIDIKLGLSITHEPHCRLVPCWRFVALKLTAFDEPPAPPPAPLASSPTRAGAAQAHQPLARPPSRSSVTSSSRLATSTTEAVVATALKSPTTPGPAKSGGGNSGISSPQVGVITHRTGQDSGDPAASQQSRQLTGLSSEAVYDSHNFVTPAEAVGSSPHVSSTTAQLPHALHGSLRLSWSPLPSSMPVAAETSGSSSNAQPAIARSGSFSCKAQPPPQSPALVSSPVVMSASGRLPREETSALAQFLAKYSRLLPVMSEQYYKGLAVVDNANRNAKLCFMSLEEAELDAKMENTRRIELISKLQSPLSLEARKIAANRQLKSERVKKQQRSQSRPRGASGSATNGKRAAAGGPQRASARGSRQSTTTANGGGKLSEKDVPPTPLQLPCGAEATSFAGPSSTATPRPTGVLVHADLPCDASSAGDGSGRVMRESRTNNGDPSPHSVPSLPPTPRNDSIPLLMRSSSSSSSILSSSSDDDFFMDKNRAEGES